MKFVEFTREIISSSIWDYFVLFELKYANYEIFLFPYMGHLFSCYDTGKLVYGILLDDMELFCPT